MRKIYRTAKGKPFDMEKFIENRGDTRAVGNVNMNARGDVLGKLNEVKITREQLRSRREANIKTEEKLVSLKGLMPDNFDTPEETVAKIKQTKRAQNTQFDSIDSLQHKENKRKKLK